MQRKLPLVFPALVLAMAEIIRRRRSTRGTIRLMLG
jgi:hypothetical protein